MIKTKCALCRHDYYIVDNKINGCINFECELWDFGLPTQFYELLEDNLLKKLGFCGCGNPNKVFVFIKKLLDLKINKDRAYKDNINSWYEDYSAALDKLFAENTDNLMWLVEYVLDDKEITSHGGNVSGSWVEDLEFKNMLDLYCEGLEKE